MKQLIRAIVGVVAVTVVAGFLPAEAAATPSSGISAVTLAEGDIPAGLLPFVAKGVHVAVREITVAPGGTTGWHYHDGDLVGLIRSGTFTHPGPDCVPTIYRPGEIIREPHGQANTHAGRNLGATPVVLDVLYLLPLGKPLSEDAPAPGCDKE